MSNPIHSHVISPVYDKTVNRDKPFTEAEVTDILAGLTPRERQLFFSYAPLVQRVRLAATLRSLMDYAVALRKRLSQLGHSVPDTRDTLSISLEDLIELETIFQDPLCNRVV